MIFGSNKITIASFSNNKLLLSTYKQSGSFAKLIKSDQIEFEKIEVDDNKILNPQAFTKKVFDHITNNKLNLAKIVILLPEKSIYLKGVGLKPDSNIDSLKSEFVSEIPIEEAKLLTKTIIQTEFVQFIAYEKEQYHNLKNALDFGKSKVKAVLPLPVVLSHLYPQTDKSFVNAKDGNEIVILSVAGQTTIYSETREISNFSIETVIVNALTEINNQADIKINNVVLINVHSLLLIQQLANANFKINDLKQESDLSGQTANYWFRKKSDWQQINLIPSQNTEKETEKKTKFFTKPKLVIIFIFLLLIALLISLIAKFLILPNKGRSQPKMIEKIVSETKVATQTPIATTQATPKESTSAATSSNNTQVSKSNFKVEILNGNGIAGDASSFKQTLEKEGFVISNTSNATNSNYLLSEIIAKATVPVEIISTLDKILQQFYTQIKVETLADGAEVDIQIILGAKK